MMALAVGQDFEPDDYEMCVSLERLTYVPMLDRLPLYANFQRIVCLTGQGGKQNALKQL
jgi:hypothetical protein